MQNYFEAQGRGGKNEITIYPHECMERFIQLGLNNIDQQPGEDGNESAVSSEPTSYEYSKKISDQIKFVSVAISNILCRSIGVKKVSELSSLVVHKVNF
jgi:hypothetical protein